MRSIDAKAKAVPQGFGNLESHLLQAQGVSLGDLDEVYLAVEGLEALRLADPESLTTSEAALRMGVSRHTFGRIPAEAQRALSWVHSHRRGGRQGR